MDFLKHLAAALTLLVLAMNTTAPAQTSEDDKLAGFFKTYLDEHFCQQPLEATQLGDHRFDARLENPTPAARAEWFAFARRTLKELPRQVAYKQLSRTGQIDFEIFQHELQTQIWMTENTHPFEEDPRTYGDYINGSVYLPLTQSTLPHETNIANCLARMTQIPRVIATAKATLTHPPKPVLETAIRQNRGAISFYEKELFESAGETPQLAKLKAAAAPIVAALNDYQKFLETDLMARADGEWRLGAAKFKHKFDLMLDAGVSADQVFADAQSEFERVQRDLYVIARQLWAKYFSQTPLPPDDAAGRRETITKVIGAVNQDHGTPENLVADASATVTHIKAFIHDHDYLRLPEPDNCRLN